MKNRDADLLIRAENVNKEYRIGEWNGEYKGSKLQQLMEELSSDA